MISNILIVYLLTIVLDLSFTVFMSNLFSHTLNLYYEDMNESNEHFGDGETVLSPEFLCNVGSFLPVVNLISIYRKIKFICFK